MSPLRKFASIFLPLGLSISVSGVEPARQTANGSAESVVGSVVDAVTGQPLGDATVLLTSEATAVRLTVTTGPLGAFAFSNVRLGRYEIAAVKAGYSQLISPVGSASRWVKLSGEPQRRPTVELKLHRYGSLTGRIISAEGQPIPKVNVYLGTKSYDAEGKIRVESATGRIASFSTNDVGEFRIYDIAPGEYLLCATRNTPVSFDASTLYSDTYFPGTADLLRAETVQIKSGEELRLPNMTLLRAQTAPVRLTFPESESSKPQARIMVVNGISTGFVTSIQAAGQINIGVPSGHFDAVVAWRAGNTPSYSRVSVDVGTSPVVEPIEVNPMRRLRIQFVGQEASGSRKELETATCAVRSPTGDWSAQCVGRKGDFSLEVPDGLYRLEVDGLKKDSYISEILDDRGMRLGDLVNVNDNETLLVVVKDAGSVIAGIAVSSTGSPVSDALVVLVPDDGSREVNHLYRTSVTDLAGGFELRGVAPGSYQVFAWGHLPGKGAYRNKDFLRQFEDSLGVKVTVQGNKHLSLNITVSP